MWVHQDAESCDIFSEERATISGPPVHLCPPLTQSFDVLISILNQTYQKK